MESANWSFSQALDNRALAPDNQALALDNQALALTTKPWPWQPSPGPDTQINCWLAHEFAWVGLAETQNQ